MLRQAELLILLVSSCDLRFIQRAVLGPQSMGFAFFHGFQRVVLFLAVHLSESDSHY